jgi:hypothetical protein
MKKFLVPVNANEKRRLSELEDERRADEGSGNNSSSD